MNSVFRVLEVYRPAQRKGPILLGAVTAGTITVGSSLVSVEDATRVLRVIAVDMPTAKSQAEGRLALVVLPDLGDSLRPGALFDIVPPDR
jgi:hypothetical protein